MFSNANVIFRTKFVDGISTVNRTIGIGMSSEGREKKKKSSEMPVKKRAAGGRKGRGKENLAFSN